MKWVSIAFDAFAALGCLALAACVGFLSVFLVMELWQ